MERFRLNSQEARSLLTEKLNHARQNLLIVSMPAILDMNRLLAEGDDNNTDVAIGALVGAVTFSSVGFFVSKIRDNDDFEATDGVSLENSGKDTIAGTTALSLLGALLGAATVLAYKSISK
jgi:hypothetical protein